MPFNSRLTNSERESSNKAKAFGNSDSPRHAFWQFEELTQNLGIKRAEYNLTFALKRHKKWRKKEKRCTCFSTTDFFFFLHKF